MMKCSSPFKTTLIAFVLIAIASGTKAQKIDSIYFNLYTDSLKKGAVHFNYINVDGKLSDGRYWPLDTTQIRLSATRGKFEGNVLTLDSSVTDDYVIITAVLKENPSISREVKVYVKKNYAEEALKSQEELIEGWQKKKP